MSAPKYVNNIVDWGAPTMMGFYLEIIEGAQTKDDPKSRDILSEFLPYAYTLFRNGFLPQVGGSPRHTTRYLTN